MSKNAISTLSNSLNLTPSAFAPYGFSRGVPTPTHLSNYISPVQFQRMAHDVRMWRDAMREMELSYYPQRARSIRMYIDVAENPFIKSVVERWEDLTVLRDYCISDSKGIKSDVLTQQLENQTWFEDYIKHTLDALMWGYTLIELGDIENDSFPNITATRRENIRPDGIGNSGPILTSLVYAINGVHIQKDNPLIDMCNHWIPTKSNRGVSSCGYGLYYNIALLEIHLRHVLEWNADYVEMYGQPIKKGFTNKIGKDRDLFERFLGSAASNSWALLDRGTNDDIIYEMVSNAGTAWKSYENFEKRLEVKVQQLILGHGDAMASTPGKLGGMQAANKDGFNESLIEQAMNDKQTKTGNFVCRKINEVAAPRFRRLGNYVGSKLIKNLIPTGYTFSLLNDKEVNEVQRRKNAQRLVVSTYVKNLNDGGWDVDAKSLSKELGMDVTASIPERKLDEVRQTETIVERVGDKKPTPTLLTKSSKDKDKAKNFLSETAKNMLNG